MCSFQWPLTSASALTKDLKTLGLLFESLVMRYLRVLSQPLDGEVFHYRDKSNLKVDAIIQLPDNRWGAFEVKLGSARIDEAAASLLKFATKIDTTKTGTPTVLAVITPGGYGYLRPDGISVIPLSALGT